MKQKIVIKVSNMNCNRCRSKAMKIAVDRNGIQAVSIEGDERDRLVVTGEGVDSVSLARCLRKKLRFAEILTVEAVKEKKEEKKEKKDQVQHPVPAVLPAYCVICDTDPSTNCSIL